MTAKIRKPKVNIPGWVKVMAMMNPDRAAGKRFLKAMVFAIYENEQNKQRMLRQVNFTGEE